jgi:murein DD-endopeptidase MepM/ murein hydrolase activator NlpD
VKFEYYAPGDLIPGTGFGRGDDTVYAPNMLFPIKSAPTFPQSMVYRLGGAVGGDQCDPANYQTAWRDNFCEQRSRNRNTPLCPTNQVHQGQDIRVGSAADCNALRAQSPRDRGLHEVIAVEDGVIQHIGTYSVKLKGSETGIIYSYLHLNMRRLQVSALDTVEAGDTLGFVSNDFGGTPTTFHLHFEMKAPIEGEGIVHVPPYMSLVAAYERREQGIGKEIEDDLVAVASAPVIVDPSKLIE